MYPGEQQGATDRRRAHKKEELQSEKAKAIQQKALIENPSPDNPNLCFFFFCLFSQRLRLEERKWKENIVRGGQEKRTFHFHVLSCPDGKRGFKKKIHPGTFRFR